MRSGAEQSLKSSVPPQPAGEEHRGAAEGTGRPESTGSPTTCWAKDLGVQTLPGSNTGSITSSLDVRMK